MPKVTSKDGTPIAFDRLGTGPPLILIDGALCYRSFGPMAKLVPFLTPLVVYEAPFIVDDSRPPIPKEYARTMKDLLAAGKRSAAVKQFLRAVGVPGFFVFLMQFMPMWAKLKATAHTLAEVLPNAEYNTIPGQTHMLKPAAIAPVLVEFLKGEGNDEEESTDN